MIVLIFGGFPGMFGYNDECMQSGRSGLRINSKMVAGSKLTYERSKNVENDDFSDFQFDFIETSGRYQGSILLSPLHQNDS